jgi:zinc protease
MTLDNINSVAAKYIDTNIWTWMIVGDLSKIEEGIRELNLGEIEIIKLD